MINYAKWLLVGRFRPAARPAAPRARLGLLRLEDRVTPVTNQATGVGDWSNPSLWSLGTTPDATHDVQVNLASGTFTHAATPTDVVKSLTSNGTLNISAGRVDVLEGIGGTVSVTGGGALFVGAIGGATKTTADLVVNTMPNVPVQILGTLDNTNRTITINGGGNLILNGGTLVGGTVVLNGGAKLLGWNGTLDGVTVSGGTVSVQNFAVDAERAFFLNVRNGLTLQNNVAVELGFGGQDGYLAFLGNGPQTLGGTGTVTLGSSTTARNGLLLRADTQTAPATLTIGSGITISGGKGYIGHIAPLAFHGVTPNPAAGVPLATGPFVDAVVNNGTIDANTAGGFIVVNAEWTNNGQFRATGGGTLALTGSGKWNTAQPLTATGSKVYLSGGAIPGTTPGGLTVSGGTVYALGDGTRLGPITATNGAVVVPQNAVSYTAAETVVAGWTKGLQFDNPAYPESRGAFLSRQPSSLTPDAVSNNFAVYRVQPYFANLAVVGLLRAGTITGPRAKAWLDWYLANVLPNGTIHDRLFTKDGADATPGTPLTEESDGDDSNAATFLLAAWTYYQTTGDAAYFQGREAEFRKVADLVVLLMAESPTDPTAALTRAILSKPNSGKYLEDNCEVYVGLRSMVRLMQTVFPNPAGAAEYDAAARKILRGINTLLFDSGSGYYRWAAGELAGPGHFAPWYANSQALAWPALFDIPTPAAGVAAAQFAAIDSFWNGATADRPNWADALTDRSADGYMSTAVGFAALARGHAAQGRVATEWALGRAFPTWQLGAPGVSYEGSLPVPRFTAADGGFLLQSLHLMGTTTPTSTVAALPALSPNTFTVSWAGTPYPGGAGVAAYSVYYSDNGGAFQPLVLNTAVTSATFTGVGGHTYGFYSVATDAAGHVQPTPLVGQEWTTIPVVAVSSGGGQTAAVGTAFGSQVVVRVGDQYGNPVKGWTVTFAGPPSGAGAVFPNGFTKVTGSDGKAGVAVAANTIAGSYTVTATAAGLTPAVNFGLTNVAGPAAVASVTSGGGQSVEVGTGFGSQLVARVTDQYGNPVAGETVSFAGPPTGASATFPNGFTVVTGADGNAGVAASANTVAGSYTVTASVAGVTPGASFTLTNVAGPASAVSVVSGGGQSTTVGMPFASPLVARVTDQYGNPVAGETVTFAGPPAGAGVTFPSGFTVVTGTDGKASASVAANTTAGSSTVTASVAGGPPPSSFGLTNVAGPAAAVVSIAGGGQSATVGTGFGNPLVVRVTDQYGNPVAAATVTFAGAGATFPSGFTAATGADGKASLAVAANTAAGSHTVTASVAGVTPSASFSLTNLAGPATVVSVTSGTGQSATVGSAFGSSLVARVADQYGNPVAGATVTFAGPAAGAGATFPSGFTVVTGADGMAGVAVAANATAGAYPVTASVAGVGAVTFNLTNTTGPANRVAAVSGGGQSATVGAAFPNPLVVSVTDAYGNHVSGAVVTFAGSGATFPSGPTATTGPDGRASIAVAAGTPGQIVVIGTAAGVAATAAFTLTAEPAPRPLTPFAVGADAGGPSVVVVYNPDASVRASYDPFPGTPGGVRTAVADFTGDGVPDVAVGTGAGAVAEVKVIDGKSGAVVFSVAPFADFTGGVFLAAGDVTGDGVAELVVTPDLSGGPRVTIFRGGDFGVAANFFGIDDAAFRGGARAAVGDVNGDGFGDLVVSAGFGGGPRVAVFDARSLSAGPTRLVPDFFLFEPALRNGCYVAVGDVDGDGRADLIGGGGPGGGPRVLVVPGDKLLRDGAEAALAAPAANFFAGRVENRGGIRVAAKDFDGDDNADIVVGDGTGAGSRVTGYSGKDFAGDARPVFEFDAFPGFAGGVFVG